MYNSFQNSSYSPTSVAHDADIFKNSWLFSESSNQSANKFLKKIRCIQGISKKLKKSRKFNNEHYEICNKESGNIIVPFFSGLFHRKKVSKTNYNKIDYKNNESYCPIPLNTWLMPQNTNAQEAFRNKNRCLEESSYNVHERHISQYNPYKLSCMRNDTQFSKPEVSAETKHGQICGTNVTFLNSSQYIAKQENFSTALTNEDNLLFIQNRIPYTKVSNKELSKDSKLPISYSDQICTTSSQSPETVIPKHNLFLNELQCPINSKICLCNTELLEKCWLFQQNTEDSLILFNNKINGSLNTETEEYTLMKTKYDSNKYLNIQISDINIAYHAPIEYTFDLLKFYSIHNRSRTEMIPVNETKTNLECPQENCMKNNNEYYEIFTDIANKPTYMDLNLFAANMDMPSTTNYKTTSKTKTVEVKEVSSSLFKELIQTDHATCPNLNNIEDTDNLSSGILNRFHKAETLANYYFNNVATEHSLVQSSDMLVKRASSSDFVRKTFEKRMKQANIYSYNPYENSNTRLTEKNSEKLTLAANLKFEDTKSQKTSLKLPQNLHQIFSPENLFPTTTMSRQTQEFLNSDLRNIDVRFLSYKELAIVAVSNKYIGDTKLPLKQRQRIDLQQKRHADRFEGANKNRFGQFWREKVTGEYSC